MTNSGVSMNPSGGDADWRYGIQPALGLNLMGRVAESANCPTGMAACEVQPRRTRQ